jgi:UDP-N-acetylglucosamine--N-acetylmuramyl-(pentapeptide) pyrophosphoryl-undecaprenol N-acetylglucosamine transferase
LTGGGSGGHITPLLPLARALKHKVPDCRVVYIGLKGEKLGGLQARYQAFDEVYSVSSGKFRRYHGQNLLQRLLDVKTILLNLRDLFRVVRGTLTARGLLRRLSPDVVFSKGGYVVVPVGLAAKSRHIPIVTHDSDTVPGLANRFIGKWAAVHATGMPPHYYSYDPKTMVYTGIPVDDRIKTVTAKLQSDYKKHLKIDHAAKVLMVGGAGHGARDLNHHLIAISADLLAQIPNLQILHISGQEHLQDVQNAYADKLNSSQIQQVRVIDFTPDFYQYTGAADLVITRAGATTIAELALQHKAVLLIPAPFLTGGHQLQNAKALAELGAAEVLENDVSAEQLLNKVVNLLNNQQKRHELADNIGKTAHPEAAKQLAEVIVNTAQKNKDANI